MEGNETSISTGGSGANWNPENIIGLVTGVSGFVASLLTFAYIKFKKQFSDEQNTDIHLQTISHEGGKREIVINIKLKNEKDSKKGKIIKYDTTHRTRSVNFKQR